MNAPDLPNEPLLHALYGEPPAQLVAIPAEAIQVSPLIPDAASLEAVPRETLASMVMLAPPGTVERRHALAAMLGALAPGAPFVALAPKTMGGSRLGRELTELGCPTEENAKAHHRICRGHRPVALDEAAIAAALDEGAPRLLDALGLWTQPGIFSWDRIDPGTALLREALPALSGRGADFGCGIGLLAHTVLASTKVTRLDLLDIDRRAVESARRNVDDPRAEIAWRDVRAGTGLSDLDFVVMNPPFHESGTEDRSLGQIFIQRAAQALHKGGRLWLVANRHLPYEAVLAPLFRRVTPTIEANGYKVVEAMK